MMMLDRHNLAYTCQHDNITIFEKYDPTLSYRAGIYQKEEFCTGIREADIYRRDQQVKTGTVNRTVYVMLEPQTPKGYTSYDL